ncbi:MAG: FAD-dependent oxidoreductase [Acidobacteriota bacterium]|nr:FAD-dependent oxidoreductase [Acidobacteriota bacterium]
MPDWDLIVVGGGIVGSSIAYQGGRRGLRTLLLDRRDHGRATDAGAGILSPETELGGRGELRAFALAARRHYDELGPDLPTETAFDTCGLMVVALDSQERSRIETLLEQRDGLEPLSSAAAKKRFPPLASVEAALFNPRAARVDGRLINDALQARAADLGVEIAQATATGIRVEAGSVAAVEAEGVHHCRSLAIAGGAWTSPLVDPLGCHLPVAPQRGQIVHLRWPDRSPAEWPMVSGFREHYLVPWADGRVAAGATRETGSGFEPMTTASGIREVLDRALELAPGLAGASIAEIRVGLRPLSADGLPIVGKVPGLANAWVATGHGPAGLMLGPYSAKVLVDAIATHGEENIPEALQPSRFGPADAPTAITRPRVRK